MLQAQVVEVVVSVPPAQDREILGGLEDAGDGYTGLGSVVHRGGRATPREALRLEVPARVEDVKRFGIQGKR